MIAFLKRLVPIRVKKAYWRFIERLSTPDFSQVQYEALQALKCIVAYNKYGGYCVPKSSQHRPAASKVLRSDVYEPLTIEFMRSHCSGGDIIHAGTYFGDFLPALAQACGPTGKVWAFEPNLENYRCAQITILLNSITNVELYHTGLGQTSETQVIATRDESGRGLGGASKILSREKAYVLGGEDVQIVTVDDTVPTDRDVSILQLDVEGYEKEALSGALRTLARCRPIIVLEMLPESGILESNWFAENVLSLGYQLTQSIHGNVVFVSADPTERA